MSDGDETSCLLHEDERPIDIRRRPLKLTQMGSPPPRLKKDVVQLKTVLQWAKAIAICLAFLSGFLTFAWHRRQRSTEFLAESAAFTIVDKCDLRTYPLKHVGELTELNLSGCEHTNLPADSEFWSRFSSLKKIDLNNNSLTDLPEEMAVLSSLEILFLSENVMESIPTVISKLSNLRVLSLRGNLLKDLSATNLPTSSLVWLILTNNRIRQIHSNIGEARLLRKLMLSHNRIESVPTELGKCKELELVRLADNNINKSIPREVLSLPKLAWISLSGNPIFVTPQSVEKVINESEIQMTPKILGNGASGTVYQAKYQDKDVAVKIFKEGSKGSDGNAADEAGINALVDHSLAISAIGIIKEGKDEAYKGMVMTLLSDAFPLGKAPNFDTVTRDEGPSPHSTNLTEDQILSVMWNIVSVLNYIHSSLGVSHGDIYLHNVLRDDLFTARLSDWGASFVYDRRHIELAGMFERIEVLAFGRLVQDLLDWHLGMAMQDLPGPMKELLASAIQPDQASRPGFRVIKDTLGGMIWERHLTLRQMELETERRRRAESSPVVLT
ncbi:hypothetical protein ACHAW5_006643 [Stephanodiscus triporus]|uniref:Protein kinase domain-containing protein n=1 Tax=Stephanodiscus triporus TaxID=2934178 RepID=A0ABD3N6G2_9STRA